MVDMSSRKSALRYEPLFSRVEDIIKNKPSFGELERELFRIINRLRVDPDWFLTILHTTKQFYSEGAFFNNDLKIKFATNEGNLVCNYKYCLKTYMNKSNIIFINFGCLFSKFLFEILNY